MKVVIFIGKPNKPFLSQYSTVLLLTVSDAQTFHKYVVF
jgi:hypothetical protein